MRLDVCKQMSLCPQDDIQLPVDWMLSYVLWLTTSSMPICMVFGPLWLVVLQNHNSTHSEAMP